MKEFFTHPLAQKFYITDLYLLDEFILVNGRWGLDDGKENTPIKRIYFDLRDNEIEKQQAQRLYGFENEIPHQLVENCVEHHRKSPTSLNYNEFIDFFVPKHFFEGIETLKKIEFVDKFYTHCTDSIDNHHNPRTALVLLKDIVDYTNDAIHKLNSLENTNTIQQDLISYFTKVYTDFIDNLTNRYKIIYPEVFENKEEQKEQNQNDNETPNPHPRIFKNFKSYNLFSDLLLKFSIKEGRHTDFSFIYRQMQYDGYIDENVGDSEFRDWFNTNYDMCFEKTKTLDVCKSANNGYRITIYDNVKQSAF